MREDKNQVNECHDSNLQTNQNQIMSIIGKVIRIIVVGKLRTHLFSKSTGSACGIRWYTFTGNGGPFR